MRIDTKKLQKILAHRNYRNTQAHDLGCALINFESKKHEIEHAIASSCIKERNIAHAAVMELGIDPEKVDYLIHDDGRVVILEKQNS